MKNGINEMIPNKYDEVQPSELTSDANEELASVGVRACMDTEG